MRKGTTALVAFPLSHTPTSNVRYIAFSMSFNENKLRTFTLPEMVTTQVVVCWLGILFGTPLRGAQTASFHP